MTLRISLSQLEMKHRSLQNALSLSIGSDKQDRKNKLNSAAHYKDIPLSLTIKSMI